MPTASPTPVPTPSPALVPTPTAPPVPTPTATPVPVAFTLTSPVFEDGTDIPKRHACDGDDISPQLDWAGAPPETAELVLIVDDPDAGGFVHWHLAAIPPAASGTLAEGAGDAEEHPDGQGRNHFGTLGWGGPCPPERHLYSFSLKALSEPSGLEDDTSVVEFRAALEGKVIAEAQLSGMYEIAR